MPKQFDSVQTDRVTSRQGRVVVLSWREAKILTAMGTIMGVWTVVSISYLVVKGLRAEPGGFLSDTRTGESKYVEFYSSPAAIPELQVPASIPITVLKSPIEPQKTSAREIQAPVVIAPDAGQSEMVSSPPPAVGEALSVSPLPSDDIGKIDEAEPTVILASAGVNANGVAAGVGVAELVTPPQKVLVVTQTAPTQPAVAIEKKSKSAVPAMETFVKTVTVEPMDSALPYAPKSVDTILPASVESFSFNRAGYNLITNFSIRNLGRKLLTGTIVGEADFVSDGGKSMIILAEESFRTKTVSTKEVRFYAPGDGTFTSVRFRIKEENTKTAEQRQLVAEFPISL